MVAFDTCQVYFYPGKNICSDDLVMYVAFNEEKRIARGSLLEVSTAAYAHKTDNTVVIFEESTYQSVDIDCLSGSLEDLFQRVEEFTTSTNKRPRPRGRPKMGVVSREVSLLPRHWEWLESQKGGISATLRRLVASARKDPEVQKQYRQTVLLEKAHRFCTIAVGDIEGFEEALRALYRRDLNGFSEAIQSWPHDIAETATQLAIEALEDNSSPDGAKSNRG